MAAVMPKNIAIGLVIAASLVFAALGYWNKRRNDKQHSATTAEVSLDGPIADADKKAKPSRKQCERFVDDDIARMEPDAREPARAVRGTRVDDCESKFTIAALKCIRDGEAAGKVMNNLLDPYGCAAANPRK